MFMVFLIGGCPSLPDEEPLPEDVPEPIITIDVQDDAYMAAECVRGNDTFYGAIRCKSLVITEVPDSDDFYVDLENCSLPIMGDGWTCEGRVYEVQPLQ